MARILIGNIRGPQGIQGIPGPQGIQGIQGPQGPLPPLTNNALATQAGVSALDAVMGKTLQDQITQQNNNLMHGITDNYAIVKESNYTLTLCVRNSICYASMTITTGVTGSGIDIRGDMPTAITGVFAPLVSDNGITPIGLVYIDPNTNILKINSSALGTGWCNFCYPVVER